MPGQLKAKVDGVWVPVTTAGGGGGGGGVDEVWIGPGTPPSTDAELWYDSDEDDNAVDAANYWNSAWGLVAEARWSSAWTNATNTPTIITASSGTNTFTAFLYAGRRYRLYWQGMVTSTAAGDYVVLQHNINGSNYSENNAQYISSANVQVFTWIESRYIPAADGNYTFTVTGRRGNTSTGTVSTINSGNNPLWLMIEDLGPVARVGVSPPAGQPFATTLGNALGIIAKAAEQGPNVFVAVTAGGNSLLYETLSVFLAIGRRYRVVCTLRAISGTATSCHIDFTGLPITQNDTWQIVDGSYRPLRAEYLLDGDGAQHAVGAVLYASAQALTAYTGEPVSHFYVEDVGPNVAPALPIPEQAPPWTPVTAFLNGWANYGGWQSASYRKVGDEVQLRGLVQGGTIGAPIFTLPVGYRPPGSLIFACDTNANAHCRIDVQTGGNVLPNNGSNAYVSITGIRFSVTP